MLGRVPSPNPANRRSDAIQFFLEAAMQKLKSIVFVAGVMLLILAAAVGYLSIKYLAAILPADSYEDKGVTCLANPIS